MKLEPGAEFYMVWRKNTGQTFVQHRMYGTAVEEAKRLAEKCPKEQFFVLKAINTFTHIDMNTSISLKELSELPEALIAQLSPGMQKKIKVIQKQIEDWTKIQTIEEY